MEEIRIENGASGSDSDDHSLSALQQKIQMLESENQKMHSEFNMQRAKLKELYVQKETEFVKCSAEKSALQRELDEMRSQFLVADLKSESEMQLKDSRAQEEIASLQQLVQETIEETSCYKTELEKMKEESYRLWQENRELREEIQQQETPSLAPQVLSHVKTIARKLAGDSPVNTYSENTDDQSRKNGSNKYANEDAEVLRSLVDALQEEMKALKEKLRSTDDKLQACHQSATTPSDQVLTTSTDQLIPPVPLLEQPITTVQTINSTSIELQCKNCHDYEEKFQKCQKQLTENQEEIVSLKKLTEESREDLRKEAALRKDLEVQWQEKREAHKSEVQSLKEQVKKNEKELLDLQQKFLETKDEISKHLLRITEDRERVNKQLETLQADNDFLSGRYLATADEIENQYINLPNNVEELHELILQQQNELIQARVGCEFEKQKCVSSLDEVQILRDQLESSNNERRSYKKKVQLDMKSLQDRLTEHLVTLQNYETSKTALERKEVEMNKQISKFHVEIIELQETNEKLSKISSEYKIKIKNLQEDLATSEQVQKDFVKLSQSLQMALEKFRTADTEVRWKDDEDIDNCPTCNIFFTVTVRKIHCRHCGSIFCDKCLSKNVLSGPRKKPARVCDICHTLLRPNTAPYFSHEPPQSPQ